MNPIKEKPLSFRHKLFIENYFKLNYNATKAYIATGYKATGNSAEVSACNLLRLPKIEKAVKQRKQEILNLIKADQLSTVQQVQRCVFADVRKLFDKDGRMVNIPDIDDTTASAISAIKIVKRRNSDTDEMEDVIEVKLVDKKGSTEQLLKIQGLLNDKLELMGSGSMDINVNINDGNE